MEEDIFVTYKQISLNESSNQVNEGLVDKLKAKAAKVSGIASGIKSNIQTIGKNIKNTAGNIKADITGKGERESMKSLSSMSDIKQKASEEMYKKRISGFIEKIEKENKKVARKLGVEVKKYPDVVKLFKRIDTLIIALNKVIKK